LYLFMFVCVSFFISFSVYFLHLFSPNKARRRHLQATNSRRNRCPWRCITL
jgi:hypothetical protein